ncbi:hypothetical protein MRB53_030838 [Persea americana]|uniref:Uncharacterized protein n=1 Tax=Persea americana TaxID=3435 RepID=A0ACC2KMA7_PERAE|nr:hypothetical protein MRB53_030838 [Persea americana]
MVKTKTNIFNSAEKMLIVVDVEKAAFEEVEKNKEAKEESEKSDIDQSDEDADAKEEEDHHVRHSLLYYMHECK